MKRLTNEKEKESCKMGKGEFTKLIEENKLKFYKTAKVILKNDDDIYDALQEALISMYQKNARRYIYS